MRRTIWLALFAAFALTALTACMSDDNESARGERRAAALVEAGPVGGAPIQLTVQGITPAGQAIEVLSYSWGVEVPGAGGTAQFGTLQVQKTIDETSPRLLEFVTRSTNIQRADLKLYLTTDSGESFNYLTYNLEQVSVKSIQLSASGDARAREEVTFGYRRIREETRIDGRGGEGPAVQFGWDIALGRPW